MRIRACPSPSKLSLMAMWPTVGTWTKSAWLKALIPWASPTARPKASNRAWPTGMPNPALGKWVCRRMDRRRTHWDGGHMPGRTAQRRCWAETMAAMWIDQLHELRRVSHQGLRPGGVVQVPARRGARSRPERGARGECGGPPGDQGIHRAFVVQLRRRKQRRPASMERRNQPELHGAEATVRDTGGLREVFEIG